MAVSIVLAHNCISNLDLMVQARARLRLWQERVLAAVQSTQLDSASVLPILLREDASSEPAPRSTPFSVQHQQDCRFNGELEGDVRDPTKRRPLVATEDLFVDHHVRQHIANLRVGQEPRPDYVLPLTGAQLSRMPHYRLLMPVTEEIPITESARREEAAAWRQLYAEDYRCNIAVGQMHQHKDTCFKYVVNKGIRKAKHCRFHFHHFVKLMVEKVLEGKAKIQEYVLARTGKDLVLPRQPGQTPSPLVQFDPATGEQIALRPTNELGPSVITDDTHGKLGLVVPIRWNPLEGSSNGPAQVATRGNLDYQSMLRTFDDGFCDRGKC